MSIKKYYPSSAAFMWGNINITSYASGCLRHIYLRSHGIKDESFDPKHRERGALCENLYAKELADAGVTFEREMPVSHPVANTGVTLSGRVDFRTFNNGGYSVVFDELKSTESDNVRRDVIQNGKLKLGPLAQLVTYMAFEEVDNGRLIYYYFERKKGELFLPKPRVNRNGTLIENRRIFQVSFGEFGEIVVDGAATPYTVYDCINFAIRAAQLNGGNVVPERPLNYDSKYESPCTYCPFQKACDAWDADLNMKPADYIDIARRSINSQSNVKAKGAKDE